MQQGVSKPSVSYPKDVTGEGGLPQGPQAPTLLTTKSSSRFTAPSLIFFWMPSPTSLSFWYTKAQSRWRYPASIAAITAAATFPGGD